VGLREEEMEVLLERHLKFMDSVEGERGIIGARKYTVGYW